MCRRAGIDGDKKGIAMKILKLELKNFGKFQNKVIELGDGIQLLYGENEAGKSTIHTFIKSMLFGMERGRGRASVNDTFSRYEPWENPSYYAGAMNFECGGKVFRLERSFDKVMRRNSLICLDDGEELSVEDGDLTMLLGGLEASGYEDTLYIGQLRAKTSQNLGAELKNFATNYYVTGDSEINLAGAQELLKDQQKSIEKDVRLALEKKQHDREKMEQEASYIWRDIHHLEEELQRVEEALENKQEEEVQIDTGVLEELRTNKWRIHPLEILGIIGMIAIVFVLFSRPWSFLVAIIIALAGGIYIWNRLKEGKRQAKTPPELLLEEITPEEERASKEKLLWEQNHLRGEKKEKEVQYENLQEQLAELEEFDEVYKKQDYRHAALQLAARRLQEVSAGMQEQLKRDLDTAVSQVICAVTGGKYTRLLVDEKLHMSFLENGRKIPMEQVSQGTLEQIYFALRMAVSSLLHEEEYPVILDDTFAFYDDIRLEHTLRWLDDSRRQVLLFSCQNREEEVLKKIGADYTKICL